MLVSSRCVGCLGEAVDLEPTIKERAMSFQMGVNFDREFPSLYVKLRNTEYGGPGPDLGDDRHINLDVDGNVLGISFLNIDDGLDLEGIPDDVLPEVSRLLAEAGVDVLEPEPR